MDAVFYLGLLSGFTLTSLLAASGAFKLGVWPCPEHWSLKSVSFWTLFRLTNVAALGVIVLGCAPGLAESPIRLLAAFFGVMCFVFYGFACLQLGHKNLYCGADGLKVRGIYRWSRNPQYAAAIPGYLAIAFAAHTGEALVLAGLLAVIFSQMAMLEERCLLATYGARFEAYQHQVPRFYNVRRARASLRHGLARLRMAQS